MATAVAVMMAALAPAPLMAHPVSVDYNPTSDDMDAEGEDDPEVEISMGNAIAGQIRDKIEEPDQLVRNSENNRKPEEYVDEEEKTSQRHVESDEDVVEDDLSKADESSAEEDKDFDKGSSDSESAVAQEWDGGSEGGDDDAEVGVANRNNCVLVFSQ